MLENTYNNKRVLVTGHTGFKGSWLCLWLQKLNAEVAGYALQPPSKPYHFELLSLKMQATHGDVRDRDKLAAAIRTYRPHIVFHLAAQPLVRYSYAHPVETFETNVMGTINLFEACRKVDSVAAIVNITSDKCYENKEWDRGYRENDPVGGHDPYSASKGCAEIVTASYRNAFFPIDRYKQTHRTLVATARAGNVIGGGDWGADRLVPDIMTAASRKEKVLIRNPQAIRPWQHVLEPLSGYLLLGQRLLNGEKVFSGAWNFGPRDDEHKEVIAVVKQLQEFWSEIRYATKSDQSGPHEANLLKLNCSKAYSELAWHPVWDGEATFRKTAEWYQRHYESNQVCSRKQLDAYLEDLKCQQQRCVVE